MNNELKKILNDSSATIWFGEIYEGLQDLLHDMYGNSLRVEVVKPDGDFELEYFPCVTLQIPDYHFSIDRWYKKDSYVVAAKDGYVVTDTPPLPYDMHLQMDFYATKQVDIDDLQIKWLSKFQRDLVLPVINRGGDEDRTVIQADGGLEGIRYDEVRGKDRIFRVIHHFIVHGRIEEHDARQLFRIPTEVKVIPYIMKREVKSDEISRYRYNWTTPNIYTVSRRRK